MTFESIDYDDECDWCFRAYTGNCHECGLKYCDEHWCDCGD